MMDGTEVLKLLSENSPAEMAKGETGEGGSVGIFEGVTVQNLTRNSGKGWKYLIRSKV